MATQLLSLPDLRSDAIRGRAVAILGMSVPPGQRLWGNFEEFALSKEEAHIVCSKKEQATATERPRKTIMTCLAGRNAVWSSRPLASFALSSTIGPVEPTSFAKDSSPAADTCRAAGRAAVPFSPGAVVMKMGMGKQESAVFKGLRDPLVPRAERRTAAQHRRHDSARARYPEHIPSAGPADGQSSSRIEH